MLDLLDEFFAPLFASARIVDAVLAIVVVEAVLLFVFRSTALVRTSRLLNVGSGACLLLALRAALTGAWWGWIGAAMAAAGVLHAAELVLPRNPRPPLSPLPARR